MKERLRRYWPAPIIAIVAIVFFRMMQPPHLQRHPLVRSNDDDSPEEIALQNARLVRALTEAIEADEDAGEAAPPRPSGSSVEPALHRAESPAATKY